MKNKKKISEIRRNNAKLYPIYKMFSWDLLFFYSIEFLFYVITKKITASQVLIANGFYLTFKNICQIPSVAIIDFLGKKKSIVIGNGMLILYMLTLIFSKGFWELVIAHLFCAIGYDIKAIAEPNLLYDSVATKGGDGLYSKLDSKGSGFYYILDSIASVVAGFLFVINNYLPMFICLGIIIISTFLSLGFKDVYEIKNTKKSKKEINIKDYSKDLISAFKFIFKSRRMKAFILFQICFYGLIKAVDLYRSDLLLDVGVSEEEFSMIFAVLTLIGSLSVYQKKNIEKKFKNRTLSFLSITYIISCIIIGAISSIYSNKNIISIIIVMLSIQKMSTSLWYILEAKYLRNFTTEDGRNKIAFTSEFIKGIFASIFSFLAGLLLNVISIENAFLIVGLIFLIGMILILDYMRTRFGLNPSKYSKEDIEF